MDMCAVLGGSVFPQDVVKGFKVPAFARSQAPIQLPCTALRKEVRFHLLLGRGWANGCEQEQQGPALQTGESRFRSEHVA